LQKVKVVTIALINKSQAPLR